MADTQSVVSRMTLKYSRFADVVSVNRSNDDKLGVRWFDVHPSNLSFKLCVGGGGMGGGGAWGDIKPRS